MLDLNVLRASLEKKPFHVQEKSLLKLIQQAEAIQRQQREMLKTAKEMAEVFQLSVGWMHVEVCPSQTVQEVLDLLATEYGDYVKTLEITREGQALPRDATLASLNISAHSRLDFPVTGRGQVFVTTLTGKGFCVECYPRSTIREVKLRIQNKEGIHPDEQRLIFAGVALKDESTLQDHNIKPHAEWPPTLHLVLRLRGGMYDGISGRQGFQVLSEQVVFEDGTTWRFDGAEAERRSFQSKEEMVDFLEGKRTLHLWTHLEKLHTRGSALEEEANTWMTTALRGQGKKQAARRCRGKKRPVS